MLRLLIIIAVMAILVYSFKQSKKYSPAKPSFNTVLTFDPEVYVDIRFYEVFRELAKWEKSGTTSFKGNVNLSKEELIRLVCEVLDMPLEKFRVTHLLKTEGEEIDYIVTFVAIPKPKIEDYPNLEIIGDWRNYGKNSYRLWASISLEEFKQFIIQELAIPENSFTIYSPADLIWTKLL